MTETKTLNGLIKVKRNYGPSFGDVLFSWLFYGMFRMAFYRFLLPWSVFGIALNFILLFSAISVTFRALFSPRYRYIFQTELGTEDPSISHETSPESHTSNDQDSNPNNKKPTEPPNQQSTIRPTTAKVEQDSISKPDPDIINPPPLRRSKSKIGFKQGQVQYCSYCGVENPEHARFCSTCGERIR